MARKRRIKIVQQVKTLLEMYESLRTEFPEKFHCLEEERRLKKAQLFGSLPVDPKIDELHKRVEKEYRKSQENAYDGPPLLHIRLQYARSVTQSRYEASVLSNIIQEADKVVDTVTGDQDDDDYETLIAVGKGGIGDGIMSGLGLSKKALPELRILVLRVTNIERICSEPIQLGRVSVSYHTEKKSHREKTMKKEPNHRNCFGFHHVFIYRGMPIEEFQTTEFKIELKVYAGDSIYKAHVVLSTDGSSIQEVDCKHEGLCETDIAFWKEYVDAASEEIYEFALPLISGPPEPLDEREDSRASSPEEVKEHKKKKKKKLGLFS